MAIYERNESYVHYISMRDRNKDLYDPDTTVITITSPCGTILVNGSAMTQESTGVYYYIYTLTSLAIYGQYTVEVKATVGTTISTFREKFFVMPWNIVDEVRTYSGMTKKKISDDDLSLIVWGAFKEALNKTMEYHYHEKICCCIDGACNCCGKIECDNDCCCDDIVSSPICGDGYQLKHAPIGDWSTVTDGTVRGCECDDDNDECHNDICGIWIDSNGNCNDAAVEVVDATCGHIKVYQSDCSTAIPTTNKGILINYHSTWRTYELIRFKKTVVYAAWYELAIRENLSAKKVSGCDESARDKILQRIENKYIDMLDSIREPMLGGVK